MRLLALLIASLAACPTPEVQSASPGQDGEPKFDHSHALWTEVLQEHVHDDRFDYRALKKERGKLDRYLKSLHAVSPADMRGWTRDQKYAFWINVYNAHAIQLIVDHYPVDSIKDIGGVFSSVWNKEFIPMKAHHPEDDDDELSLDDVEHQILRPRYKDARVHAAVNCASVGCPPLRDEAFVAEKLDEQLDEQMRAFVADTRRNGFNRSKNTIYISEIFDWFEEDFERDAKSVVRYVLRYAPEGGSYQWILDAKVKLSLIHI